jgi:hypothetical protein
MSSRYNNDGDAAMYFVDSFGNQDKEKDVKKIVISKQKMQVGREYR